jgi:ABC-type sugar transport system permease subunit
MEKNVSSPAVTVPDHLHEAPPTRERSRLSVLRQMQRSWYAYALLLPIFMLLVVFMYYPPVLGLVGSFFRWAPGREWVFIGLENFSSYFAHPETGREVFNMLTIALLGWVTGVVVPFVMSEVVFAIRSDFAKAIYRFLIAIPIVTPGVVIVLLWKHIYDPNLGPINGLFDLVGLDGLARNWLGDPDTALLAIIGVGFPWVASIGTLIFLGGLSQIPTSIFDACLLDGCSGVQRVLYIDLPLVAGQIRLLTILSIVGGITAFDQILVLTDGGPGFATMVPGLTMYKRAFVAQEFGYASAVGLLIFLVAVGLTFVINRFIRSQE